MSQDEKESDKNFLSRWSQRKREAKLPENDSAVVDPADEAEALPTPGVESDAEEQFDLSSLPKLEEITETTDITGFLRKGVPESLRNAALRKSWALDSAVRNYVNPALDYAYDWNTPGGVPGSSELAPGTDIAKMVLQIMGSDPVTSGLQEPGDRSHGDASDGASADADVDAPQNPEPILPLQQVRLSAPATASNPVSDDEAHAEYAQSERAEDAVFNESSALQQGVRRHGTAKPRV
ncbi:MAG: DUF3306 domain-containing protein [Afipia sp.]|nr:DUF3306 domain-containing protein [Afipia sp.]